MIGIWGRKGLVLVLRSLLVLSIGKQGIGPKKNIFDKDIEYVSNSTGRLNSNTGEIERNGKYANKYYLRNGQYFEIGVSYHF